MKSVTIYGTIGPACGDPKILESMFREGMDGIRLNLSHQSLKESEPLLEAFFKAAAVCGRKPELLIDMQGPELRIGKLAAPVLLEAGARILPDVVPFPLAVSEKLLVPGQDILLDDGKLLLRTEDDGRLRVLRGGLLTSRKSVALPGCRIETPPLTEADRENLSMATEYGVTAVMQPFVRCREDLVAVRSALDSFGGSQIRLFAKIENLDGVSRLHALIPCCDEIVIARGDLGNAVPLWELPALQKRIAAACRAANRDFMVVTQMLDSMTHRQVPTRAEVCDIFNAVLDGAASVMVTGETAAGEYPVQTIRFLAHTVREAEAFLRN